MTGDPQRMTPAEYGAWLADQETEPLSDEVCRAAARILTADRRERERCAA